MVTIGERTHVDIGLETVGPMLTELGDCLFLIQVIIKQSLNSLEYM